MLELTVRRVILTPKCTVGELTISGLVPVWYTLEDVDRDANRDGDLSDAGEEKVRGETAIPSGLYSIRWQWSTHFEQSMPYLQDVPGFGGVMIHTGNNIRHTKGCLLIGTRIHKVSDDLYEVHNSKIAFDQISKLMKNGKGGYNDATIKIVYAEEKPQHTVSDTSQHAS